MLSKTGKEFYLKSIEVLKSKLLKRNIDSLVMLRSAIRARLDRNTGVFTVDDINFISTEEKRLINDIVNYGAYTKTSSNKQRESYIDIINIVNDIIKQKKEQKTNLKEHNFKFTKSFIKQIIMEELSKLDEASDPVIMKQNLIKKGFTDIEADKYIEYYTSLSNLKNPASGNYDTAQKSTLISLYNSLPLKVKNSFAPPK